MSAAKISIASQIAEVKRELALRANTYPRLVGSAKMRQGEADLCTARMEAVLVTLEFCQRHEAALRTFLTGRLYTAEELTEHVTAAVDAAMQRYGRKPAGELIDGIDPAHGDGHDA